MPIVLPKLPDPDLDETSPYCVIAKHRAKPGKADAYERRHLNSSFSFGSASLMIFRRRIIIRPRQSVNPAICLSIC
jgi:hypothetical protein